MPEPTPDLLTLLLAELERWGVRSLAGMIATLIEDEDTRLAEGDRVRAEAAERFREIENHYARGRGARDHRRVLARLDGGEWPPAGAGRAARSAPALSNNEEDPRWNASP